MDITISTDPKSEEKEKRPPICRVKMALQILDSSASEGANKCGTHARSSITWVVIGISKLFLLTNLCKLHTPPIFFNSITLSTFYIQVGDMKF